ncbi:hypothetical protein [Saccharothrix xinjiangensis]|uniref:Phage terminase large subunit-like protein n=1 Tax=Saccharothrix xinjiangensis TaxID=204798 RepID=A0ABV9XT93_9PSEU
MSAPPAEAAAGARVDIYAYLAEQDIDPAMLAVPECRRLLTKYNPLLFALLYFPHHLRAGDDDPITLSTLHVDMADTAREWALPNTEPKDGRDAWICPRDAGKSTWQFLILPAWAGAHRHRRFVAAFAHAGGQAEKHLLSFKREVDTNQLLRADFPDFCRPGRRPSGTTESDTKEMFIAASAFVFAAKGIDSQALGFKIGNRRPDLLIFDDIEPDESNYSAYQKEQRLATVQNAILPMNLRARVVISGTTTMPGSIIHDLVKTVTEPNEPPAPWVTEERIRVRYYPAILTDPVTAQRRSLWEEKWPLAFLESIEHTRSYRLNYLNDPMARQGDYWTGDDFTITEELLPSLTHMLLSIDPATKARKTSDYTGLAVIGYSAYHRRCVVLDAWMVKLPPGEPMRQRVLRVLEQYRQIRGVVVEDNNGGDTWYSVFHTMPVRVHCLGNDEPKEVRAARLLGRYTRAPKRHPGRHPHPIDKLPRVTHAKKLPQVQEQMVAFPRGANDDLVDAIGTGVDVFLSPRRHAGIGFVRPDVTDDDD